MDNYTLTIPCNRALAYNPDLDYGIYQNKEKEKFIIAKDLIDNFTDVTQLHLELIDTFNGKNLKN